MIHINVSADLQVAMQMLRSSLRGAIANIRTNLKDIHDPGRADAIRRHDRGMGTDAERELALRTRFSSTNSALLPPLMTGKPAPLLYCAHG